MKTGLRNGKLPLLAVLGIVFLLSSYLALNANGLINLPTTAVCAKYYEKFKSAKGDSFFDVVLSNVPDGFDVANTIYPGWCIDPFSGPPPYNETEKCDTLLESSIPPPDGYQKYKDKDIPWNKINYLLNHKNGAVNSDIQPAIWYLITGLRQVWVDGWTCEVGSVCDDLVKDANAYADLWEPLPGDIVAVILRNNGIGGYRTTYGYHDDGWQDVIIEVQGAVGRFTGGGHQISVGGVRITRGLTIHCDLLLSNNLEVNWNGNQFHMLEHITTVACTDDPDIIQFPPAAPLDTLIGVGTGRYNGEDGYTIEFTLVDAGEPGSNDQAALLIYETLNPLNVVLEVPLQVLTGGNLQAHYDQPHK
jgi:hypothetical protein